MRIIASFNGNYTEHHSHGVIWNGNKCNEYRMPNVKAIYPIYFKLEILVAFDFCFFFFYFKFSAYAFSSFERLTYSFRNDNQRYVMHDDFTKKEISLTEKGTQCEWYWNKQRHGHHSSGDRTQMYSQFRVFSIQWNDENEMKKNFHGIFERNK